MKTISFEWIEKWLIILVALHSIGVGIGLIASPPWAFKFAGYGEVTPLFFPHQAGVFHLVVACGYLIEYFRYRGVILLLTAKAIATVFLLGSTALGETAWIVWFSGVADGLMGIAVFFVHRMVVRDKARM